MRAITPIVYLRRDLQHCVVLEQVAGFRQALGEDHNLNRFGHVFQDAHEHGVALFGGDPAHAAEQADEGERLADMIVGDVA